VPTLRTLLKGQRRYTRAVELHTGQVVPWVFSFSLPDLDLRLVNLPMTPYSPLVGEGSGYPLPSYGSPLAAPCSSKTFSSSVSSKEFCGFLLRHVYRTMPSLSSRIHPLF